MASTIRQNRRKQDISALFAESEFPPLYTKRQRTVPPSPAAAAEFGAGICARPDYNDLEDDELRFRGFSYTCATGKAGDAKSFLDTFACQRCPDIFNSRIGLTNHSKLHGAQLPLGCDFCDFSCTNTKTLRQHRRAHGYLPRPRRSSAQKSAEKKKQKPYAEPIYAGEEKIIIFCPNKAADDGEKGTAENAIAEENTDEQQFGDPPLLARATLNRAGLEEEDEEETAEEASVSHLPSTSFSSATTSATTMAQRRTRKKAAKPTEANIHNKEGTTGVGTSAAGSRRQKGVGPIRCSKCPFTSPSRVRLQSHMDGHHRSSGFLCSVCGYKHESVGWLHLHCTLHLRKEGIQFQWPPAYVKEAEEEEEEKEHNVQKNDRR